MTHAICAPSSANAARTCAASLYDSVIAGGSLFHPDGTLRQALDAALSSPSGLGVAVDDGGQVLGGVRAEDVLEALEKQRQA